MQSLINKSNSGEKPEIIKSSFEDDKLFVLTEDKIEVINNSCEFNNSNEILGPVKDPHLYHIRINDDGIATAYIYCIDLISGFIFPYLDRDIIIECNGNIIKLYKYFSKEEIGEQIFNYIISKNISRPEKLTGMILEMRSSELSDLMKNQDELDKKIEEAIDVLIKYQNDLDTKLDSKIEETIDISKDSKFLEKQIPSLALLLTVFAHFKKSLAVIFPDKKYPNKINAIFNKKDYDEIISRIIEFVKNILSNTKNIPNYNDNEIRNFFVDLSEREINNLLEIYRNSSSRSIEDFNVASTIFGCKQIVSRPKKPNSEDFFSIRELSEDTNKEFRIEYQNSLLDNIVNDRSISKKIKLFMFLWKESNGLQDFVNEVSVYPK